MSVWSAARAYADRGIPVFPARAGRKEPATRHGYRDASTDPAEIDRWAAEIPGANLAVPTGHRSGWLVIDVDPPDGPDTLRALEADLGALPETLAQVTPRGGHHRIYRMPTDAVIRCSAGRICGAEAPGLDVRADGGYIVVAPSVVGGVPYRWATRGEPTELPAAWVRVLARQVEQRPEASEPWAPRDDRDRDRVERWVRRALQTEARDLAAAPQGTRNDRLWRAAAALAGLIHTGAIDAQDVRRALTWACAQWTVRTPSKDEDTLERAIAWGAANPRSLPELANRAR